MGVLFLPLLAAALVGPGIEAKSPWWKTAVLYQIYPYSFKDSNGDGVGDINGVTQKLEYVQSLGVTGIRLAPVFRRGRSGCDETGIVDFRALDPLLGTSDDMDRLVRHAKQKGLKIILDMEPNHSSNEHEWFKQSVKKISPYSDYYIWKDGKASSNASKQPSPPNNWLSTFGGSAWEWNAERQQYYLHQFTAQQPDLNYRNNKIVEEMKDTLTFWLEKGIDGFMMSGVSYLLEDVHFLDEPPSHDLHYKPLEHGSLKHIYTKDVEETLGVIKQWREVLDRHAQKTDRSPRLLMVAVDSDTEHIMKYYSNATDHGAHFPLNSLFITKINKHSKPMEYSQIIHQWMDYMHEGRLPNWMWGNSDVPRVTSRTIAYLADGLNMLLMLLPGVSMPYGGEEVAMVDHEDFPWNTSVGLRSCHLNASYRDQVLPKYRARTPFQWDSSTSAGFSTNSTTWLPVNTNYKTLNLHQQKVASFSHYQVYRRLVSTRQEAAVRKGQLTMHVLSDSVLSFSRSARDKDTFVVVINFSNTTVEVNLKIYNLPKVVLVHTASINSNFKMSDRIYSKKFFLPPYASVVLTTGKVHEYSSATLLTSFHTFILIFIATLPSALGNVL